MLTGQRDDTQPVRRHLLVQSSPGHDAFHDGGIKGGPLTGNEPKRGYADLSGSDDGGDKATKRKNKRQPSTSDGMAHALYDGDWKLVIDIEDKPAALYDLRTDLSERTNLLAEPARAEQVRAMEKMYREVRASK